MACNMTGEQDTWTVRLSWDRRKRPRKMIVEIHPKYWDLEPREREATLRDVRSVMETTFLRDL